VVLVPTRLLIGLREVRRVAGWVGPRLFPGRTRNGETSPHAVRRALRTAVAQSNGAKHVTLGGLRRAFEAFLLDGGSDLELLHLLLGEREWQRRLYRVIGVRTETRSYP
jgi:site-specific recombinase XerD